MTAKKVTSATVGVVTALSSWQAGYQAVEEVQHDQNPQL
jgi:hypothetical protein